jgi:hypothetical protein
MGHSNDTGIRNFAVKNYSNHWIFR